MPRPTTAGPPARDFGSIRRSMPQGFLSLALLGTIGLVAAFGVGLASGPSSVTWARAPHVWLGLGTTVVVGLAHGYALAQVGAGERRVREWRRTGMAPGWLELQAWKHARRAWPFAIGGAGTVALAAALGLATAWLWVPPWCHGAASGVALGFHLGAFAIEFVALITQGQLLRGWESHEVGMTAPPVGPG